jgi:hypothetical protein
MMLMTELVLGIAIEWIAVHRLGRWMYTAQMPLVAGLAIGAVPVAQMLILPPVIFRLVTIWRGRTAGCA